MEVTEPRNSDETPGPAHGYFLDRSTGYTLLNTRIIIFGRTNHFAVSIPDFHLASLQNSSQKNLATVGYSKPFLHVRDIKYVANRNSPFIALKYIKIHTQKTVISLWFTGFIKHHVTQNDHQHIVKVRSHVSETMRVFDFFNRFFRQKKPNWTCRRIGILRKPLII